ncbi:hypothetical protein GPJ56_002272 [Histomonas meleagridis]|uniref:uncharacterized protein n=1 Tax=Histomonas meleagridis TaxID=135588 RepID=UPI00355A6CAD|nr:hypothetical protein GPJ56_002272 [Histomonas meleagridis]KAH0802964.1 hypothetical protein GO595_004471 [Histomonas meleagridis]
MNIFSFNKKKQICQEASVVYAGLVQAYEGRRAYAKSWSDIGSTSCVMLISQIPELKQKLEEVRQLFSDISEIHYKLANEEERAAEDFRDVIERFSVVYRVNQEYITRKQQYVEATHNLEDSHKKIEVESQKPNYEKYRVKLEQQLADAKKAKEDALRRSKRKALQMANTKDVYNKFKVRRTREGFSRYNNALKDAMQNEIRKLVELRDLIYSLKLQSEETAKAIEVTIEKAMTEQVAPPAPVVIAKPMAMETTQEEEELSDKYVEDEDKEEKKNEYVQNDGKAAYEDYNVQPPLFEEFD